MTLTFPYKIGEVVYLRTDPEQLERIITSITIRQGSVLYGVTLSDEKESWHSDFELSKNKNILKAINN